MMELSKSGEETPTTTTKILVIDDDQAILGFLKNFLVRRGMEVTTATSGDEALSRIGQDQPGVILLDVRLPGMGGLEVLHRIKQIDRRIDVIMITGFSDEEVGRQAMAMGAFDYILKPFDLDYLERVLWWKLKMR